MERLTRADSGHWERLGQRGGGGEGPGPGGAGTGEEAVRTVTSNITARPPVNTPDLTWELFD